MTKKTYKKTKNLVMILISMTLIIPILIYLWSYATYVYPGINWQGIFNNIYHYKSNNEYKDNVENMKMEFIDKSTSEPFTELADWNNWAVGLSMLRSEKYKNKEVNEDMYELKPKLEKPIWFNFDSKRNGDNVIITLNGLLRNGNASSINDFDKGYPSPYMPIRPTKGTSVNRLDCRIREIKGKQTIEMIVRITDQERSVSKLDNTEVPYTISCTLNNLKTGKYVVDYFNRWLLTGIYKPLDIETFGEKYRGITIPDEDYYFAVIDIP